MPITFSIDHERRVIHESWEGDITIDDLRDYWTLILSHPEVIAIRRTLVDLRRANVLFTGTQMWDLVNCLVIPRLGGRDWKTAILVESPTQYGISRQYQVFAEHYSKDTIFDDFDTAMAWLLKQ